jgi:hypothetical protein
MVAHVGYSVVGGSERSGGVMCGLHHARGDEERGFLG